MLYDLKIKNYRLFNDFDLSSIARVNLIVGTNNSGKSSLLEAILLLMDEDPRYSLLSILNERGEYILDPDGVRYDRAAGGYQVSHIFHGHQLNFGQEAHIYTSTTPLRSLNISFQRKNTQQYSLFDKENVDMDSDSQMLLFELNETGRESEIQSLRVTEDGLLDQRRYRPKSSSYKQKAKLVTTNYLGYDELARLWDNITLTPREEKVVEALQILEPEVERISFTSRQTTNSGILLKSKGEADPIPLGSMGDGMRRILAIVASLVSVENGTLLIDEIDTGLYHQALIDMWRLIFRTSIKSNAQVFATTHSWDCVKAFQKALEETQQDDLGILIRLQKENEHIQTVVYTEDELDIAIKEDIEVR